MNTGTDTVQVIGAFVVVVGGFLTVAKIMLAGATKEREADRNERLKLSDAIERMAQGSVKVADTNKEIAQAVTKQAQESAERNGHIIELIIESRDNIVDSVQHIKKQHVTKQEVDQSIVKEQK